MTQFVSFDLKAEVCGETVLALVKAVAVYLKDDTFRILRECNMTNPVPGEWYPTQAFLSAFEKVSERIGSKTLYGVGKAIPDNAVWPAHVKTIEQALASIDVAFHMNHRNGFIGNYRFQELGPHEGLMTCENPYPCDFDWGIIEATADKFKEDKSVVIEVTHEQPSQCRKHGSRECVYRIRW